MEAPIPMDPAGIRTVTDAEVAHYRDHGWVKLDGLVSPDLAARMLERAKALMGPDATGGAPRADVDPATMLWQDRHDVIEEDACFASVGLSARMGENAQRLLRRNVGILLQTNLLAVKIGTKQSADSPGSPPTGFHQDGPSLPLDRAGRIAFWIALDSITPEMGPMRFVDRSHRLGSLGNIVRDGDMQADLFEMYPELGQMRLTEPGRFRPGDATAHTMYTVHDALANETDRPRWAFIINYLSSDTLYNGAETTSKATLEKIARAGLRVGEPFGGPLYPRVV